MAVFTDEDAAFIAALKNEKKAEKALDAAQKKMSEDNSVNGQMVAAATADLTAARQALKAFGK